MQNRKDLRAKSDWNAREPKRNGTVINMQRQRIWRKKKYATMHEKVKELTDRKRNITNGSGCIMSKDGELLFEKSERKMGTVHT